MKTKVVNSKNEQVAAINLPKLFESEVDPVLVHSYWLYVHRSSKLGLAKTKTRGEVRGGGRKPWRQKGTGNARIGSIRAPHWRGGGVTFGPTGLKNPRIRLNKKVRKSALIMALAARAKDKSLIVIDSLNAADPKTKNFLNLISPVIGSNSALIIVSELTENLKLASRNLVDLKVISVDNLNLKDLLGFDKVVATKDAVTKIEKIWGLSQKKEANGDN